MLIHIQPAIQIVDENLKRKDQPQDWISLTTRTHHIKQEEHMQRFNITFV